MFGRKDTHEKYCFNFQACSTFLKRNKEKKAREEIYRKRRFSVSLWLEKLIHGTENNLKNKAIGKEIANISQIFRIAHILAEFS